MAPLRNIDRNGCEIELTVYAHQNHHTICQDKKMTIEIPSSFIGDFKVGDNIAYNADILCSLCEKNENGSFNKLIVLQVGSILEASMGQIIYRAQNFNREGVPNIAQEDRQEIEGKKIDKLNSIIDVFRKYGLISELGLGIYDDLHQIRKYRNKIHIQDSNPAVPDDEERAFTDETCDWSLDICIKVIALLNEKFCRPAHLKNFVRALRIPEPCT